MMLFWGVIPACRLQAPFLPKLKGRTDYQYFDPEFTAEPPRLTPRSGQALLPDEQAVFEGFSYTEGSAAAGGPRETVI